MFQVVSDRGELLKRSFQILHNLDGDDVGIRKVGTVLE